MDNDVYGLKTSRNSKFLGVNGHYKPNFRNMKYAMFSKL